MYVQIINDFILIISHKQYAKFLLAYHFMFIECKCIQFRYNWQPVN